MEALLLALLILALLAAFPYRGWAAMLFLWFFGVGFLMWFGIQCVLGYREELRRREALGLKEELGWRDRVEKVIFLAIFGVVPFAAGAFLLWLMAFTLDYLIQTLTR